MAALSWDTSLALTVQAWEALALVKDLINKKNR